MLFNVSCRLTMKGKTVGYRFTSNDDWYLDLGVEEYRSLQTK